MKRRIAEISTILTITGFYYVLLATLIGLPLVSFFFLLLERGVNPAIHNYGDTLWWSVVTFTIVGYGDIVPVSSLGRILAAIVMFSGIAFFCTLSATLSNYFQQRRNRNQYPSPARWLIRHHESLTEREIKGLSAWIDEVESRWGDARK